MRWWLTVQLLRLKLLLVVVLFTAVLIARLLWSVGPTSRRSQINGRYFMADVGKLKLSLDMASTGSVTLDGIDLSRYSSCIEYKAEAGELAKLTITLTLDVEADIEFLPERLKVLVKDKKQGGEYCTADGHIRKYKASAA